ncbi:SusC/RagA family TonB-linked outer membrane protein [Chitinophaga sp. CF118]|uniref:SusC/RagA family TonB-linked outer membrane protein n=1 Tax=Chitinophaga sp. CF118 TaxID=1884367 RepID=UPI001C432227|nr:SusC/RagA family TonB-linked outer membrane protein [Chitinophaga sp. CF118]
MCISLSYAHANPFQDSDTIKVSLRVNNMSLKQVLRLIEKQTGLSFAISSSIVENSRNITIQVQQQPLKDVLRQIFTPSQYAWEIRNKQIIIYPSSQPPPLRGIPNRSINTEPEKFIVSGVISDGERPLPGVSIREKGTHNGVSSSENGRFRLEVNNGQAVLQLSLIGYESQEIPLRERHNVDALLQGDTKILNDLVIIGYGIQNKANITGSITKVEGRRLKSRPVNNVIAALQGTAPGLLVTRNNGQPGKEGFNIQIRGLSSVNNSEPLVLVDGAPGSITLLNPNDIESVSVLKDAAAASIYGPLAASGVVLVTTKRGKSGKISVEYNSLFGVERPIHLPERMHSWQAAPLQNEALQNAGLPAAWTSQEIAMMKDPAINFTLKTDGSGNYNYYDDFNPLQYVTRNNSTTSTYNVSARGGSADHQYYLSLGQFSRQGLFNTGSDNTSRTNLQLNINNRLSDVFSLETSLQYAQSRTLSPGWRVDGNNGILNFLYQAPGNVPIYVPGTNKYTYGFNSYALLKDAGKRDEQTSFADAVFTLKAENLFKGLTLKTVYSPQLNTYHDRLAKKQVDFYEASGLTASANDPNSFKRGRLMEVQHSLQLLADYDLPAGEKNSVHILGGYAFESHYQHQLIAADTAVSANELAQLSFNDPTQHGAVHFKGAGSLSSLFARINYNYNDRYLLEANLVAAKLLFNNTETADLSRQHLFPSFSAGWRLNNEKWFSNAFPFFDEFKLRASWGMLGSFNWRTSLNDFNYYDQLHHPLVYPITSYTDFDRYIPGNNNWETITTTNGGLDMAFFKGRLNINADYFVKHNPRMQIALQTPMTYLLEAPVFYTAAMRSWGWELNLGWRDNRGSFSYWVNANLFDDQNKIFRSNGNTPWLAGNNHGLDGLPYNSILGYKSNGFFQDNNEVNSHAYQGTTTAAGDLRYTDVNNDGIINVGNNTKADHGDLVYLGSSQPRYSYGFDGGFSWKGLDFSVFLQGIGQRKVLVLAKYSMPFVQGWQQPWEIHQDSWRPDNPNAAFPRLYAGDNQNLQPSSFWVMNAAYIRLKNLQLGYTFHFAYNRPLIKTIRVYFSGQDLWEVNRMKIKYYDPEQAANTGYQYPFFRSFTLGLNATF